MVVVEARHGHEELVTEEIARHKVKLSRSARSRGKLFNLAHQHIGQPSGANSE